MKNLQNFILSKDQINNLIKNPPISDTQKFINELMNIDIEIGSRFINPKLPKIVDLAQITDYDFGLSDNSVYIVSNFIQNNPVLTQFMESNPFF